MAGRNKTFDEKDVIAKAALVFWEKGYDGSSADDLLKAMGIGKGSFYLFFKGGKRELYEKAMRQYVDQLLGRIRKDLLSGDDGIQYLKDFFMSIPTAEFGQIVKGCLMGNVLAEMSAKDEVIRDLASRLLMELEDVFTQVIAEAKASGKLKTTASAELLGRHLINLWNGLNLTDRMYPNDALMQELVAKNLELLN